MKNGQSRDAGNIWQKTQNENKQNKFIEHRKFQLKM